MTYQRYQVWIHGIYDRLAILPRHLTLLSLTVMMGLIAASGYLLVQDWARVRHDREQAAWNQALGVADNFNAALWRVNQELDTVIRQSGGDRDPALVSAKMAEALGRMHNQLAALVAVDFHGRVTFSSTSQIKPGSDLSGLDAFKAAAATRDTALGAPWTVNGVEWLPRARPVHQSGSQDHIGVDMLRLSYFQKSLDNVPLTPGEVVAVFELGGPEILRSPHAPPGSDLLSPGLELSAGLGNADTVSSVQTSGIDHVSRLITEVRTGGLHFGVLVAIPMATVWQDWWPQAIWIIGLTIALLSMMLAFHLAFAAELQRRHRAEAEASRLSKHYRLLAEHSSDALCEIKFKGGFRYVSPAMERLLGWTMEDLAGVDPRTLTHPDDCERMRFTEHLTPESGPQIARFRHRCKRGGYLWVEASIQLTFDQDIPDGIVTVLRDITDRVEAERRLAEASAELGRLAATDQLTGLANRRHFDQGLDREWQRAAREEIALSLLLFDIDFFKLYNDSNGHAGGDDVLQAVSAATTAVLHRSTDLAARWGGEEFVILLPNTDLPGAIEVAERVRTAIENINIPHHGAPCGRLTVSVGVATAYPAANLGPKPLVAEADANLYEAKRQGRNRVVAPLSPRAALVKFGRVAEA